MGTLTSLNPLGHSRPVTGLIYLYLRVSRTAVIADKPKYMVMCRDQNGGESHNIKTDDSSFVRVEEFK
jgi:hypothetical protein